MLYYTKYHLLIVICLWPTYVSSASDSLLDLLSVLRDNGSINETQHKQLILAVELDRRLEDSEVTSGQYLKTANLIFIPVRSYALDGYKLLWEGELRLTLDAFRDMGLALGLALALIFGAITSALLVVIIVPL